MSTASSSIEQRIVTLEAHLEHENPLLLDVVKSFRELDMVAYRLGILSREESFTTQVPWWPMVAVLGTFSSGKSSFINHFLQARLQSTGNQAVDDRFTVICFGTDETPRTLPGLALDADPRFPFYQVSRDIESVAAGEGGRIDAYLQLRTCRSEALRGKIFIDSPGFDADAQRTATLRITDHIIDLSDLVLVFFDARHPEPGAMQDTLRHLVGNTIHRPDSNKFLYILNQIDNAAREDNPEDVFAAWQRALAQAGLTAGRFYSIYNPDAALPIEDPKLKHRFETKRAEDVTEIYERIHQVEVERVYRIVGVLEKTAKTIEHRVVPAVASAKASWRRAVLWLDGVVFGALVLAFAAWDHLGGILDRVPILRSMVQLHRFDALAPGSGDSPRGGGCRLPALSGAQSLGPIHRAAHRSRPGTGRRADVGRPRRRPEHAGMADDPDRVPGRLGTGCAPPHRTGGRGRGSIRPAPERSLHQSVRRCRRRRTLGRGCVRSSGIGVEGRRLERRSPAGGDRCRSHLSIACGPARILPHRMLSSTVPGRTGCGPATPACEAHRRTARSRPRRRTMFVDGFHPFRQN